jgi:hypothetical protein
VLELDPGTNYGTEAMLRTVAGSNPDQESYLRFNVTGLSGTVTKATLRLYVDTNGTFDGPAAYPTSASWTETGITWTNRPGATGPALSDKGAITAPSWVEWDVTALITGNGTYNLKLAQVSNDGVDFRSREAASNRPQLVVQTS